MDELLQKKGPGGIPVAVYAFVVGLGVVLIARLRAGKGSSSQTAGTQGTVQTSGGQQIIPVILGTITTVEQTPSKPPPVAHPGPVKGKPKPKPKPTPKPNPGKGHTPKPKPKPKPAPTPHPGAPTHRVPKVSPLPKRPPIGRGPAAPKGGTMPAVTVRHAVAMPARTITATHTTRAGQSGTGTHATLPTNA